MHRQNTAPRGAAQAFQKRRKYDWINLIKKKLRGNEGREVSKQNNVRPRLVATLPARATLSATPPRRGRRRFSLSKNDLKNDCESCPFHFAYLNLTELAKFLALELGGDA
jgi:hypothetical protein